MVPIRADPEEGGRSQLKQRRGPIPPPRPASDTDAGLEASIRLKLDNGEPLDAEERAYLARLPGDDEAHY